MVSASARRRRREASAAADAADEADATDAAANEWTRHAHAEDERREHLERNPQLRRRLTLAQWNHRQDFLEERRWRREEMLVIWEEAERVRMQQGEPDDYVQARLERHRDDATKLLGATLRPRPTLSEWIVARHPFACIRMSRTTTRVVAPLALVCAFKAAVSGWYLACVACVVRGAALVQIDRVHAAALSEPNALCAAHRISRGLSSPILVAGSVANAGGYFVYFVVDLQYRMAQYNLYVAHNGTPPPGMPLHLSPPSVSEVLWRLAAFALASAHVLYVAGVLAMLWTGSVDEIEARGTLTGSTTEFVVDAAKEEALRANDAECIVCFSEFSCGDACRKLPCGHFFHTECIDQWLAPPNGRARTSCPVCSRPLTGGFAPTEYDRIAFGLGAPSHGADEHTAQRARLWTVGYPRADHLARLQVHFVQELDGCDDAERDEMRRKHFLFQLRLLRRLSDLVWEVHLGGTLGSWMWDVAGLGHVFSGLRTWVCASWL